ncbi:MAG: hypothetical protein GC199_08380 [Alphaproteobacteria bacterium]|nr:hypothetical protein [Alphaproteobacteria bacterium]
MTLALIKFWREFEFRARQRDSPLTFVHDEDASFVKRYPIFRIDGPMGRQSWENYLRDWYGPESSARRRTTTELSLPPHPYAGNILDASVLILSLNGGANHTWYRETFLQDEIRERALGELAQSDPWDGKHTGFDLSNCGTSSFSYWGKRNENLARAVASQLTDNNLAAAYQLMATHLATLELVAYPSRGGTSLVPKIPNWLACQIEELRRGTRRPIEFDDAAPWDALPSSKLMLRTLWTDIVPSAISRKRTIIVTRRPTNWGFNNEWRGSFPSIVVYSGAQAQAASLAPNSSGGIAILDQLRRVLCDPHS